MYMSYNFLGIKMISLFKYELNNFSFDFFNVNFNIKLMNNSFYN